VRAGEYRFRGMIQESTEVQDAHGEMVDAWADLVKVWMKIVPVKDQELIARNREESVTTHKVFLRYSSEVAGVNSTMRILFGARVFAIQSVLNLGERNRDLELLCEEGLQEQ